MSFEFEKLLENGGDYGLDAFLRAITKAAYDKGFEAGLEKAEVLKSRLEELSSAMDAMSRTLNASGNGRTGLNTFPVTAAFAKGVSPRAFANGDPTEPSNGSNDRYVIESGIPMPRSRVARGLVQDTVATALDLEPGRSIKEYEALVLGLEPEISVKSVGNELRRGERSGRYKRDRPGGYRWYLVGSEETETEGPSSEQPSASHSNQGDDDATDNMT